jgi:hypothetical protein
MRRRIIRCFLDQTARQRLGLLETTFAQGGERCADCLGAPSLIVRSRLDHVNVPPACSKPCGIRDAAEAERNHCHPGDRALRRVPE